MTRLTNMLMGLMLALTMGFGALVPTAALSDGIAFLQEGQRIASLQGRSMQALATAFNADAMLGGVIRGEQDRAELDRLHASLLRQISDVETALSRSDPDWDRLSADERRLLRSLLDSILDILAAVRGHVADQQALLDTPTAEALQRFARAALERRIAHVKGVGVGNSLAIALEKPGTLGFYRLKMINYVNDGQTAILLRTRDALDASGTLVPGTGADSRQLLDDALTGGAEMLPKLREAILEFAGERSQVVDPQAFDELLAVLDQEQALIAELLEVLAEFRPMMWPEREATIEEQAERLTPLEQRRDQLLLASRPLGARMVDLAARALGGTQQN